jgi:hypothetical protein
VRGALALLLGGKPKGPVEEDSEGTYKEDDEGAEDTADAAAIAKIVIDSFRDGDDDGAAKALVELVKHCK